MFTQQQQQGHGHHHHHHLLHEEFLHQHFLSCPPPPPPLLLPSSSSSTNLNNMNMNMNMNNNNNASSRPTNILTDRWKPNIEIAPNCPRCDSSNTKFCYYNNYSLTQPRYFCKGCRRYWTKGGSLRNVPVGGGCRKNRRGKSVRLSSNHCSTSPGDSPFSGGTSVSRHDPLENNNMNSTSTRLDNSSSSAAAAAATNTTIDLALVYAKYLNQQPADSSSNNSKVPDDDDDDDQFSRDNNNINHHQFDDSPSLDFSSINSEPIHETHTTIHHHQFSSSSSQEQCNMVTLSPAADPSPDTQLSTTTEGSQQQQQQQQQVFLGEVLELNHFNQNDQRLIIPTPFSNLEPNSSGSYLLQPLLVPSEDPILHDNLWLNSPVLGSNSTFSWHNQATPHLQAGSFEPMIDHHHSTFHSNPMESSWSSFDLPSFEAFPRQ